MTGGIGAGKSEALKAFARHGAATLSADDVVHGLLREDEHVRAALRERWGTRVFQGAEVDRGAIADIVFADRGELEWLEAVLHPRVAAEQARWWEEVAGRPDPPPLGVVEVPLLYETGAEERFDAVVVVTAPANVRAARTSVRADERGSRLLPDEEKARRADFAYVNDGSLAALDAFVAHVFAALTLDGATRKQ